MMKQLLYVGLGGAAGSIMRYVAYQSFPVQNWKATLLVNIIGSLMIGFVAAYALKAAAFNADFKLFIMTGLLGGFTTFSAFSLDNLVLLQQGKYATAILYIILSVFVGLAACYAGYKLIDLI